MNEPGSHSISFWPGCKCALDASFVGDQIVICELFLGLQPWMKKPSFTKVKVKKVPDIMVHI
jgi:hypothetical protein